MTRFAPLVLVAVLGLSACGSSTADTADTTTTLAGAASTSTLAPNPNKPKVAIPEALPTKLEVTELRAGDGPKAAAGNVLVVDYVGVRSADGTEFDNSWDRGTPIDFQLGGGNVIAGWDEGLVGAQAGGQYQLDIPADLAYGDKDQGTVIKAGDALSFVIDVDKVVEVTPSTAADEPTVSIEPSSGATEVTSSDIEVGTGATAQAGDTVYVDLVAFRGDTAAKLDSSFGNGGPFALQLTPGGGLPGLVTGIEGMKVGGSRKITIPPAEAFGQEGSEDVGIPADTDLIVVIKLAAAFATDAPPE